VPNVLELLSSPFDREVLELILVRQEMGRPFAAPPNVPAERMAILRGAFEATLKDPAFLTDAARLQMDIDPLTGPQIEALLAKAYSAPRDVVAAAARLVP
jgi:hypothetical protein